MFGAVRPELRPERGVGAGLVLPHANADAMTRHLAEISEQVAPGAHALVVLGGAGWHKLGAKLHVPENARARERTCPRTHVPGNITPSPLPPYAPELNPVELIWQVLRQNQLSNRVFDGYEAIVDACCSARNAPMAMPEPIASTASRPWAKITA